MKKMHVFEVRIQAWSLRHHLWTNEEWPRTNGEDDIVLNTRQYVDSRT